MFREQELDEIYDGKFYTADDDVPVGCNDCEGCADCCKVTGDTIILDPFDMYNLCKGLGKTFTDMIETEIEIRLVDGLILPNIMVHSEDTLREDGCPFLNENMRCSIHSFRPGVCRLFPMGRYYDSSGFHYILQVGECTKDESTRYPVKLCDWIGLPDLDKYEEFQVKWHEFRHVMRNRISEMEQGTRISAARYVLQAFYVQPYDFSKSFYDQIDARFRIFSM
ncbi:MAG: YkgJ family cysteine cluster protein [Parasporobacterium sp.]|nr:YkgJ family cysteine cluster protein [Parasporobacterium sp.]